MRTPNNTPNHNFPQQILLRNTLNKQNIIMTASTNTKQPLGEPSSNLPSPTKSPSKVPLPPSPKSSNQASFAEETGSMDQMFKASTLSQKPALVRQLSEAHDNGQTYVSPSDDILSPTTKKLSEVKGRRIGNFKKSSLLYNSQNLFKKSTLQADGDTGESGSRPSH
ncbi:hypothetical protein LTR70_002036 [Exophiala xenobiotica]|uniref:Exophilin 5 n=1 Tax=Lithohypha guttulata TaxID=1690604 RepID=A0ABR0KBY1_9EURO|nr:hypothetical protein LTR24_005037 [Lithohypha guttulata]KAK5326272.1 hypothetical protein LTR70_002036 [Exophiala xenobiotica]